VEGAWEQVSLYDEHVSGVHLPGADAGCGVVGWDAGGRVPERVEVHNLFDGIINELAAVQLPPELEDEGAQAVFGATHSISSFQA
jgi:hypothetical protein